MRRLITLAIVLFAGTLCAGCEDAAKPEPQFACMTVGDPYVCRSTSGECFNCTQRGIVCPAPTKLYSKPSGELGCRLEDASKTE